MNIWKTQRVVGKAEKNEKEKRRGEEEDKREDGRDDRKCYKRP